MSFINNFQKIAMSDKYDIVNVFILWTVLGSPQNSWTVQKFVDSPATFDMVYHSNAYKNKNPKKTYRVDILSL